MVDQEVRDFKRKLVAGKRRGIVLDIDDTLSWTIGSWVEQLQQRFGNPENLSVKEMSIKYKYALDAPYWQTREVWEWVEMTREDNQMQENLTLIEGASDYVKKIQALLPIVGYLTIRPRSVLDGTYKWLKKYNFPRVEVLARPAEVPSAEGDKWKAEVLDFLYPQVQGIVDDKMAVVEYLPKDYQGTIFLYDNETAEVKNIKVIPCKAWPEVYAQIKLVFGDK